MHSFKSDKCLIYCSKFIDKMDWLRQSAIEEIGCRIIGVSEQCDGPAHTCSCHGITIPFFSFLFTYFFSIIFFYFISFSLYESKRRIFSPLFLFCAFSIFDDSSVLQNLKILTYLLPNFSYKDPRLTEVTYHCINFNDRVRKAPYLNFWNFSDPIAQNKNRGNKMSLLGIDTCPSLNDIMEIRCNKCTRSEQGYDF